MANLLEFDRTPQEITLEILKSGALGCLNQIKGFTDNALAVVWTNFAGLTPQQVFDALNTQGKLLIQILTALKTAYNAHAPAPHQIGALVPMGFQVSYDAEGRVAVTQT